MVLNELLTEYRPTDRVAVHVVFVFVDAAVPFPLKAPVGSLPYFSHWTHSLKRYGQPIVFTCYPFYRCVNQLS